MSSEDDITNSTRSNSDVIALTWRDNLLLGLLWEQDGARLNVWSPNLKFTHRIYVSLDISL